MHSERARSNSSLPYSLKPDIVPVSYTHLDVYKRQAADSQKKKKSVSMEPKPSLQSHQRLEPERRHKHFIWDPQQCPRICNLSHNNGLT